MDAKEAAEKGGVRRGEPVTHQPRPPWAAKWPAERVGRPSSWRHGPRARAGRGPRPVPCDGGGERGATGEGHHASCAEGPRRSSTERQTPPWEGGGGERVKYAAFIVEHANHEAVM